MIISRLTFVFHAIFKGKQQNFQKSKELFNFPERDLIKYEFFYIIFIQMSVEHSRKKVQFIWQLSNKMIDDRNRPSPQTPVLLVCIYNQYGNIITHDYLYQLFCPFGNIIKILIFEKAKVWKTFIEYEAVVSAEKALSSLNNKVIFQDGSKMNIFRSKLKHVEFQNSNLGGVNYSDLKQQQKLYQLNPNTFDQINRRRRSTFQDYIQSGFTHEHSEQSYYSFLQKDNDLSSTEAKYKSESLSAKKSIKSQSFNPYGDIDEQFRQIALESQEYRQWEEKEEINRKKSQTIANPHSQQFLLQNCPSKVLFIRSISESYTNECIYNIFANFGKIVKVIHIKQKNSALVQFQTLFNAIQAKDEINYAKSEFKVFYSHYQSLVARKSAEDEEEYEYKSEGNSVKPTNFNPPTQVLYLTLVNKNCEEQLREMFMKIGSTVVDMEWKLYSKDKWMCLVEFGSLSQSLLAMGKLQGAELSNGRRIKLAFTRSKIKRKEKMPKFTSSIRQHHDEYL